MAIVEVKGYGQVELPDGMSQAEMAEALDKLPQSKVTVQSAPAVGVDDFASNEGGAAFGRPKRGQAQVQETKPLESMFAGVTKSVVDPFVGTAQFLSGNTVGNQLAQRLGQEADYYAEKDPMWYGTGRVGGALIPATAAAKATNAIGAIPSFLEKAGKLSPYIQSSVLGATSGLITPEETGKTGLDYYKGQGVNAAIGGVAAPVVTGGVQATGFLGNLAKRLVEPFTETGKDKVIGRALIEGAGGEADKALANIANYKAPIKGVEPTLAEVARVPSLAALERSAISNNPVVGNIVAARDESRNALRKSLLENLSGKQGQREALETAREMTAENNYLKAFTQKMAFKDVPKELLAEKDELLKSPAIQQAVKDASANLANFGQKNVNPTQSIQGLHEIKLALDDQIAKLTKPDMKQSELRKIAGIEQAKQRLLGFLENDAVSPAYKKAREVYAAQSKPINEMQKAEKIAEKIINPNTDAIYPNQLARQVKTAERGNTVNKATLGQLQALLEDVSGQQFARQGGKTTGSDTAQKLAYSNLTSGMGVPNWLQGGLGQATGNLLGQFGNMAFSNANKALSSKLAEVVTDPKEAARLMKLVKDADKNPSKISDVNKRLIDLLGAKAAIKLNPFNSEEE